MARLLRSLFSILLLGSFAVSTVKSAAGGNLNGLYTIANPNPAAPLQFSTDYSTKGAEFFDVYSPPIRTRYGEVFWTMMDPVPLPDDVRERFAGKTMAVIGYEANQVRKTENGDEEAVPITWAYNHHYVAYLVSENSKLVKANPKTFLGGEFDNLYDQRDFWVPESVGDISQTPPGVQNIHLFSEGNGGEFRKTFHGYPKGYASLIYSPSTFRISPMQIDTHNRDHSGYDYVAGPQPKTSQAPPNASYSGLLECPCTDRLSRELHIVYTAQTKGVCETSLTNASECFTASHGMGASQASPQQSVSDPSLPTGCSIDRSENSEKIVFNTHPQGAVCGGGSKFAGKVMAFNNSITMTIDLDQSQGNGEAIISMSGPSGVWFGVGFNAQAMADLPYAIIVNGSGQVEERKLGNHEAGRQLTSSVNITSNTVSNGQRTVVLTRPMKGLTADHFTFSPAEQSSLPLISAIGSGPNFAEHKYKGAATLALTTLDGATCVCKSGRAGSIGGIPFKKDCWDEPYGDLVQQKNPTCWVDTYAGGLRCCHHQWILLDKDQNPWPDQIDQYQLKFRFWFQEYDQDHPQHTNLVRIHWQTEVMSTEYDVPRKNDATPPENAVHQITARWKVGDMMHDCDVRQAADCTGLRQNKTGIKLIYAGAHCHAPSCLSEDLYNADTGELLCHHEAVYGQGSEIFDEKGYLWIPPCLWGSPEEGLQEPIFLSFDTNLLSVKRNNNTHGHYGEMALLQMKGILV